MKKSDVDYLYYWASRTEFPLRKAPTSVGYAKDSNTGDDKDIYFCWLKARRDTHGGVRESLVDDPKALKILRARVYEAEKQKKDRERSENRKNQIGSGDRSERIRTYNFPQGRVTDHRINLTLHKIDEILDGNLDELNKELSKNYYEEASGL